MVANAESWFDAYSLVPQKDSTIKKRRVLFKGRPVKCRTLLEAQTLVSIDVEKRKRQGNKVDRDYVIDYVRRETVWSAKA
jgi:hypothetical protein